ncbi:MAG: hypothetical protein JWO67_4180 [Streptosporangiaceae bacterium]|nr:hypothetical protein [Streptosporangiaceae bacterium]
MTFGGVEALLIGFLSGQLGVRGVTDVPADLASVVPLFQVLRVGGGSDDNDPNLQNPTVVVDCFAADRAGATQLSQQVDDAMRKVLPSRSVAGGTVTQVRTITGPSWRPWADTAVRRFGATYSLHVKAI